MILLLNFRRLLTKQVDKVFSSRIIGSRCRHDRNQRHFSGRPGDRRVHRNDIGIGLHFLYHFIETGRRLFTAIRFSQNDQWSVVPLAVGFRQEIVGPAFRFIRRLIPVTSKTCLHMEERQSKGCQQRYT
ncbi:hypothetical protein D3C71_1431850 [compost metagenome]